MLTGKILEAPIFTGEGETVAMVTAKYVTVFLGSTCKNVHYRTDEQRCCP